MKEQIKITKETLIRDIAKQTNKSIITIVCYKEKIWYTLIEMRKTKGKNWKGYNILDLMLFLLISHEVDACSIKFFYFNS